MQKEKPEETKAYYDKVKAREKEIVSSPLPF